MRKSVAIILAGIMAISLAACGKSSSPAGDSTGNAGTADTGETKTVNITVQSWQYALGSYKGYTNDDDLTKAIAEAFNTSHPGISANVKIMRQEDHYNSLKVDFASGDAWSVNANSSNKEAAWEFVKWLCYDMQQDVVNGLGFFSVLKDAPQITVDVADDYKAAYDTISKAVSSDNTVGFRNSFLKRVLK